MSASVQHRGEVGPQRASLFRLSQIPSPANWLAQIIVTKQVTQAAIARLCGATPDRVNRWLHDKEKIPGGRLAFIACDVGSPADLDYAPLLQAVEECQESLHHDCAAFETALAGLPRNEKASGDEVMAHLVTIIDNLLSYELAESPPDLAKRALKYISACSGSLRALNAVFEDAFATPLVSPKAIPLHLRYPTNVVVGSLLSPHFRDAVKSQPLQGALTAFQELCLKDLREEIKCIRRTKRAHPLDLLCYQHALHLLGRYGTLDDGAWVFELTQAKSGDLDPLTRKLAFTGVILSTPRSDLGDRFAAELLGDERLAQVNLNFEAYHYGDLSCDVSEMLTTPVAFFPNLLRHIARRLESRESYSAMDPVTAVTLLQVVNTSSTLCYLPQRVRIEVCRTLAAFVQHFEGDTLLKRQLGRILPLLEHPQPSV